MKGLLHPSKMIMGIASLVLSTGIFAQTTTGSVFDPITGLLVGTTTAVNNTLLPTMKHGSEYLISNKYNNDVKVMDGLKTGRKVCSEGNMKIDHNMYKGDKITDLTTQRSGMITGIKHHGTMDVMGDNGKITRYQYVTFKVKHE